MIAFGLFDVATRKWIPTQSIHCYGHTAATVVLPNSQASTLPEILSLIDAETGSRLSFIFTANSGILITDCLFDGTNLNLTKYKKKNIQQKRTKMHGQRVLF